MLDSQKKIDVARIFRLVMLDFVAGVFLAWLIVDDHRRWPVVVILTVVALAINAVVVRRLLRDRVRASVTLPAVYFCGLAFGIWWTIEDFYWWKLPLLLVPIALLAINVQRLKKHPHSNRG